MTTRRPAPDRAVASVSIVGRGRLGTALARALGEAGLDVRGPTRRGESAPGADALLLAVPDGAIAEAAAEHRSSAPFIGHVSGMTGLAEVDVDFGLHPLQTFTGAEGLSAFRGIGCAVAGRSPESLAVAHQLAEALGARAFAVADEDRAAYHSAASLASNFLVTLEGAAERMAVAAGIDGEDARTLLAPLVRRTVENWADRGAAAALTGPVARGDEATVARQRAAVAQHAPELVALFDVLTERTRALAGQREGAS